MIEATVATATREMALQQLETAIELAQRSGLEDDDVQKALDASFPNDDECGRDRPRQLGL
jgi:hypothetical protein